MKMNRFVPYWSYWTGRSVNTDPLLRLQEQRQVPCVRLCAAAIPSALFNISTVSATEKMTSFLLANSETVSTDIIFRIKC